MYEKNAIIESTMLGRKDSPGWTFSLQVDYGGSGQRVGGYRIQSYRLRTNNNYSIAIITKTIDVVGVDCWEDLVGAHVRVLLADDSFSARTIGIKHITGDNHIIFEDFTKEYDSTIYLKIMDRE